MCPCPELGQGSFIASLCRLGQRWHPPRPATEKSSGAFPRLRRNLGFELYNRMAMAASASTPITTDLLPLRCFVQHSIPFSISFNSAVCLVVCMSIHQFVLRGPNDGAPPPNERCSGVRVAWPCALGAASGHAAAAAIAFRAVGRTVSAETRAVLFGRANDCSFPTVLPTLRLLLGVRCCYSRHSVRRQGRSYQRWCSGRRRFRRSVRGCRCCRRWADCSARVPLSG